LSNENLLIAVGFVIVFFISFVFLRAKFCPYKCNLEVGDYTFSQSLLISKPINNTLEVWFKHFLAAIVFSFICSSEPKPMLEILLKGLRPFFRSIVVALISNQESLLTFA